jgi:hypothetical protein
VISETAYESLNERQIGEELKERATFMRRDILLDSGLEHEIGEETAGERVMEDIYDKLVCGLYR